MKTWRAHSWSRNELFKEAPTERLAVVNTTFCKRENCKSKANSKIRQNSAGPNKIQPQPAPTHAVLRRRPPVGISISGNLKSVSANKNRIKKENTTSTLMTHGRRVPVFLLDGIQGRWLGRMINHNYQDRWSPMIIHFIYALPSEPTLCFLSLFFYKIVWGDAHVNPAIFFSFVANQMAYLCMLSQNGGERRRKHEMNTSTASSATEPKNSMKIPFFIFSAIWCSLLFLLHSRWPAFETYTIWLKRPISTLIMSTMIPFESDVRPFGPCFTWITLISIIFTWFKRLLSPNAHQGTSILVRCKEEMPWMRWALFARVDGKGWKHSQSILCILEGMWPFKTPVVMRHKRLSLWFASRLPSYYNTHIVNDCIGLVVTRWYLLLFRSLLGVQSCSRFCPPCYASLSAKTMSLTQLDASLS